jgi:hypothetical protein
MTRIPITGEPPLTDEEIRYARQLIEQDRNQRYVVRMLKTHAPWLFVVIGGIFSALYWIITHVTFIKGTP